jgi:hypothetical protein
MECQSTVWQLNQDPDLEGQGCDCMGPLPGTPRRRPARVSGPGSRTSSMLMEVFLNELILNMFLCKPVFNWIKSYGFQL